MSEVKRQPTLSTEPSELRWSVAVLMRRHRQIARLAIPGEESFPRLPFPGMERRAASDLVYCPSAYITMAPAMAEFKLSARTIGIVTAVVAASITTGGSPCASLPTNSAIG